MGYKTLFEQLKQSVLEILQVYFTLWKTDRPKKVLPVNATFRLPTEVSKRLSVELKVC